MRDHTPRLVLLTTLLLLPVVSGCFSSMKGSDTLPAGAIPGSKCRLGSSQSGLLITEWSAAEKANLEAMLEEGAVPVMFKGCSMKMLPQCKLGGSYTWQRTTVTSDGIDIKNEADLYTKLPLGAVALSAELKRSGHLHVLTTVSGQRRLEGFTAAEVPRSPECDEATHIISAMSVGAFSLNAGAGQTVGGGAEVKNVGVGGSHSSEMRVLKSAGDADRCSEATEEAPNIDCGSPIQVFLEPIFGKAEQEGPPGSVKVDFVSADGDSRWDVYINDQASCTTPCSEWVEPHDPIKLKTRERQFGRKADQLRLRRLDNTKGPLQVSAQETRLGMLVTGMTFTALGGISLVTGIVLTSVGCSQDGLETMCSAGIISGSIGLAVVAGGIWLMIAAQAEAYVRPIYGGEETVISLMPNGIYGRF